MRQLLGSWFTSWLTRYQKSVLGIDIGTTSVKVLQLQKLDNKYHVLDYSCIPFAVEPHTEVLLNSPSDISNAIKIALAHTQYNQKTATICVNSSTVMTKLLLLDANTLPQEIEENVLILANQYIPYQLEDINYDFEVLGNNPHTPDQLDILFIAAHHENVSAKVAIVANAGLRANIVDIDIYALKNACSLLPEFIQRSVDHQTIAIVDLGATHSSFTVIQNDQVLYTREQEFSSTQLLTPFLTTITNEIQHSQILFTSSNPSSTINSIFIAGGCATLPNAAKVIEESLEIPTYIINPFTNMTLARSVDKNALYMMAPTLTIACGLAIRSLHD